jgi:hypothetical protein
MGYTTDFNGEFSCTPALSPEHRVFLKQFGDTRRMKRDAEKASLLPDPIREAVGLPIGVDGGNFVGGVGMAGQDRDDSVLEYNYPPSSQPGLWCQWTPSEDGSIIEWDGSEKFYDYVEWLEYLIEQYLKPWGYTINGRTEWQGEDRDDVGAIEVVANEVHVRHGMIVYENPELAEEFDRSSFTPHQIDLIKYALTFASYNVDDGWEDKFQTNADNLKEELKELLDKFNE